MLIKLEFSEWGKFEQRENLLNSLLINKKCPGIYAIAITSDPMSDEKFDLSSDRIVYFGMTHAREGLKGRLKQFYNSLQSPQKQPGHGGACRVKYKHPDYDKLKDNLYVSVLPVECDVKSGKPEDYRKMGDIRKLEYEAFAQYRETHPHLEYPGLPQFNDQANSPKFKE